MPPTRFLVILFLQQSTIGSCWQKLGSTIVTSNLDDFSVIGSVVDISQDGRRVAVGSPKSNNGDGAIFLYQLDELYHSWNLVATFHGDSAEGIGDFLSLSPDGLLVAIRRHPSNDVQVFKVNEDNSITKVGSDMKCGPGIGYSVTLGQDPSPLSTRVHGGGKYWLVLGCEGYDNFRGKVKVYELHEEPSYHWVPFHSHLTGAYALNLFGGDTAFVTAYSPESESGRVFRIAIGSPWFNQGQGRVQVFEADYNSGWIQKGADLVGETSGEYFGASIDISLSEHPYLVVGSPRYSRAGEEGSHGMVTLFHWRRAVFGEPHAWELVGSPIEGSDSGSEFGRSVSISDNGMRFASTSNLFAGVYELQDFNSLEVVQDTINVREGMWTMHNHIALSGSGSVIISKFLLDSGEVHALIDDSSFCQSPMLDSEESETGSGMNEFLERESCRINGIELVNTEDTCSDTSVFQSGEYVPCTWVPASQFSLPSAMPTFVPSSIPSMSPSVTQPPVSGWSSSQPTFVSNVSETMVPSALIPAVDENSPTTTNSPSRMPSFSPSIGDSTATDGLPSESPTMDRVLSWIPTEESSAEKSASPENLSSSPSNTPSLVNPVDLVTSCQCDESHNCIEDPLDKDSEVLRVCVKMEIDSLAIVSLNEFSLVQGNLTIPVVENMESKMDNFSLQCNQDSCHITLPVIPSLFEDERPPYMFAIGRVFLSQRRNLRKLSIHVGHSIKFGTMVLLEKNSREIGTTEIADSKETKQTSGLDITIFWLLLGLVMLACGIAGVCLLRKRKRLEEE